MFPYAECFRCSNLDSDKNGVYCMVLYPKIEKEKGVKNEIYRCRSFQEDPERLRGRITKM